MPAGGKNQRGISSQAVIIQPKVLVILVSALFIIIGFGIIMFVNRAKPMHPAG